jgi:hypothetical protein
VRIRTPRSREAQSRLASLDTPHPTGFAGHLLKANAQHSSAPQGEKDQRWFFQVRRSLNVPLYNAFEIAHRSLIRRGRANDL